MDANDEVVSRAIVQAFARIFATVTAVATIEALAIAWILPPTYRPPIYLLIGVALAITWLATARIILTSLKREISEGHQHQTTR